MRLLRKLPLAWALIWLALAPAWAQSSQSPLVTSVTGQTGAVAVPTVCSPTSIPTGNTVSGTAVETPFATTCTIPANALKGGEAILLHVGGIYTAAATNAATGRVKITDATNGTQTVIDTGALNGIAGATGKQWWGDVWLTFQAGAASVDVQGLLFFAAATNVQVPIANAALFPVDPTKPMTISLTVLWSTNSTSNSMQLRTLAAK